MKIIHFQIFIYLLQDGQNGGFYYIFKTLVVNIVSLVIMLSFMWPLALLLKSKVQQGFSLSREIPRAMYQIDFDASRIFVKTVCIYFLGFPVRLFYGLVVKVILH